MTTLQFAAHDSVQVEGEGGGWRTLRRPERGLATKSPGDLLAMTATLPGNLRYTVASDGTVELLGEVPSDGLLEGGEDRLFRLLKSPAAAEARPTEEGLEGLLDGTGLSWTRRDTAWVIPITEGLPRELQLHRLPGGVRVEATLIEWDEIGPVEIAALALFLTAAQAGLRFARGELDARRVGLVSLAQTEYLETDLPHSLQAVAAACRLLEREVRALLVPELAQTYLNCHRRITASP